MANSDEDERLALLLQEEFYAELCSESFKSNDEVTSFLPTHSQLKESSPKKKGGPEYSVVAPEWEDLDPTPDLHALFLQFNEQFFWSKLSGCEVKWSPRMTLCAGVCSYQYRSGFCSIRLSVPLLKLRPRKDLVETLLHEMIHAYLFVTDGNDDHDGHGPAFHSHMFRINKQTGANISVYHSFHDEVDNYRTHWWQCDGPCRHRRPFFGLVKRSMNRKPGPYDRWWNDHQNTCGGTYVKIKEPENFGKKKGQKRQKEAVKGQPDIKSFVGKMAKQDPTPSQKSSGGNIFGFGGTSYGPSGASSSANHKGSSGSESPLPKSTKGKASGGNIFGFGGVSYGQPGTSGLKTKGKSGAMVVNPGWRAKDNSSKGSVIQKGAASDSKATQSGPREGNVNASVRDIWSKKFSSDTLTVSSQKDRGDEKAEDTVHCPICNKKVIAKEINDHVDLCLDNDQSEKASENDSKPSSNPFIEDEISIDNLNQLPCPVCSKLIYAQEINRHLDFCTKL